MGEETISVLRLEIAVALVTAIKGAEGYVILSRQAGEEVNGQQTSVLVCENIDSGVIYSFPYWVEDFGDGTSGVHLSNGGVLLEGHGDIMYTPVQNLSEVPDTIESLLS